MRERVSGLCELVLLAMVRALLPARGRHRALGARPPVRERLSAPVRNTAGPDRPLDAWPFEPDAHLVRPYLLTPEERHERRLQRQRRRALWLAVHGIDVGPRHIHGLEVPA